MSEIKTQPVIAKNIQDKDLFLDGRVAGSFRVEEADSDGELSFWYVCPCGCKAVAPLLAGKDHKPEIGPSWNWNGSVNKPTLRPSVWHKGHWHGFLTDGVWKSQ